MKRKPSPAVKEAAEFIRRAQAIKAKIEKSLPATNGRPKKGDENPVADTGFNSHTISAYRKLAANKEKIGEVVTR